MEISLSVIILTHNPHIGKYNAVLACIAALCKQALNCFEIIVVENSSDKNNLHALKNCFDNQNRSDLKFRIIDLKEGVSRGAARNIGAHAAKSEHLIFLDDDTIILQANAFEFIVSITKDTDFACGAKRYWTKLDWDEKSSIELYDHIIRGDDLLSFKERSPGIRDTDDLTAEHYSFIGNFGYVHKTAFNVVGGFPDFDTASFEDDYILLRLCREGYRFKNLFSLEVLHITHPKTFDFNHDLTVYLNEIKKIGVEDFDSVALMTGDTSIVAGKQDFKFYQVNEKIIFAYEAYRELPPLNISLKSGSEINCWRKNAQLSLQDFSRLLLSLLSAESLDVFILTTAADYDNLGPILEVAVKTGICNIGPSGVITPLITIDNAFEFEEIRYTEIIPNSDYNQFPCDQSSVKKRLKLIRSRFPFAQHLSLGIIGDDDLFSVAITAIPEVRPVVLEKDFNLIKIIQEKNHRAIIQELDLATRDIDLTLARLPRCQSFICDPPYTRDGVLLFIYAGLSLLPRDTEWKEFYVILNRMMLGQVLPEILSDLATFGITLSETVPKFSNYKLPIIFDEFIRAENLFKNLGISFTPAYSSTSDLFIFRAKQPLLDALGKHIDQTKIYQHFC